MDQDALDLDEYLAQKAAEDDTLAPIQGYSQARPETQWSLTPDRKAALYEKVYNEAMGNDPNAATPPQLADVEARLTSGSAPKVPGLNPLTNFGSALANASAGRAKVINENPYVALGDKVAAARSAGLAGMAGSVLNNLAAKKQADYDAQMNADLKRAQTFRALHPRGANSAATSLGVINAAQRDDLMAANQKKYDDKVAAAEAQASPDSEISNRTRAAMYKTGVWEPGELDGMSHDQMMAARVARMQTARLDHQGMEADRLAGNADARRAQAEYEEGVRKTRDEQLKEQRRAEQAKIPGIVWGGNRVPDEHAVNATRDLAPAYTALVTNNKRLGEIQKELETAYGAVGGAAGAVEQYLGPEHAKELLDEAKLIQQGQTDLLRTMKKFGVPQEYELNLLKSLNPEVGTIQGFFKGPAQWETAAKFYDKDLREKLKANNAYLPDDPELYKENGSPAFSQQNPEDLVPRFEHGQVQAYRPRVGKQNAGAAESVPSVSEKLPTAAVPPVPAQTLPTGKKYFVLTKSGWTKTPVSKEDADRALQAGFATEVKEAK